MNIQNRISRLIVLQSIWGESSAGSLMDLYFEAESCEYDLQCLLSCAAIELHH